MPYFLKILPCNEKRWDGLGASYSKPFATIENGNRRQKYEFNPNV